MTVTNYFSNCTFKWSIIQDCIMQRTTVCLSEFRLPLLKRKFSQLVSQNISLQFLQFYMPFSKFTRNLYIKLQINDVTTFLITSSVGQNRYSFTKHNKLMHVQKICNVLLDILNSIIYCWTQDAPWGVNTSNNLNSFTHQPH